MTKRYLIYMDDHSITTLDSDNKEKVIEEAKKIAKRHPTIRVTVKEMSEQEYWEEY